ncbi:poly(ADP-ribose) polymerase family WGR domain protein (macronuclear) [Tetrahymena thermophila SB210]|uniref:Poly [ADP-ribose] polymerase n=1 Tax=Tetrahymena thermophila (strain SB210) TaxID=312017 RepID=Q24GE5_TETTS|nr:poly(ADP-ribose) polymerase family WGR domain protein [Tetrahymena thermophila SB210]EAS06926.2 poly(ADP-ribose) polymerase family WGR domain protein [Tetrahymena thermophila SB210]|eukprot:XP_001027168.2 poly(ADP-ribose) polymerase family WGR domain protein [Tetrahymena thermophila SB210]
MSDQSSNNSGNNDQIGNSQPVTKDDKHNTNVGSNTNIDGTNPINKSTTDNIKKQIIQGVAPVDEFCPQKGVEVYYDKDKIYSAKLNQANMTKNNNKFYVIQILKGKINEFFVFSRWGRVGFQGQSSLKGPYNLQRAIQEYNQKLLEKTTVKDYRILDMDYGHDDILQNLEEKMKKDTDTCQLPKQVISLMSLIFDMNMFNNQMKEIGYDAKKMPLGKLSKDNINKAYGILKDLYDEVEKQDKDIVKIATMCNDFYSYIPHDFGFKKMQDQILDSTQKVKEKLEMIDSIQNIQIATKILEDQSQGQNGNAVNLIQSQYEKLNCSITPLKDEKIYQTIKTYLDNTHSYIHDRYTLEIEDIFEVERQGEKERYMKQLNNKMLLWHGSRLTNYVGILSQGLRIAPPEAPANGYMFGKGVYFADMCSKSANYCQANKLNNTGLMFLCEVALGNTNDLISAGYNASKLPYGKYSVRALGQIAPPKNSYINIYDDVTVPIGKGQVRDYKNRLKTPLLHNEYIVYNVKQIMLKYLLRLKFNFKR